MCPIFYECSKTVQVTRNGGHEIAIHMKLSYTGKLNLKNSTRNKVKVAQYDIPYCKK